MEKYFFSKTNINSLTKDLGKKLGIKNTPGHIKACKKFLEKQMTDVFSKYGDKKQKNMPMPEFIERLNDKSISECVKYYTAAKNKANSATSANGGRGSGTGMQHVDREQELNRGRNPGLMKRPIHTSGIKDSSQGLPGMMLDGGGQAGYAPILSGQGEYITATGEMGKKMFTGTDTTQMFGDKGGSKEEIERRMLERQSEYDPRPGGGMSGGFGGSAFGAGTMPNMGMGGFGGMDGNMGGFGNVGYDMRGGNMPYNPNMGGKQKPQEINFALDGSDTRNYGKNVSDGQMGDFGGMNPNMMGGSFGGMDMGGMNFSSFGGNMGMPNMGNMGMPNMSDNMGNMSIPNMGNNMSNMGMPNMSNNMGMPNMGSNMGMPNMSNNMGMPNMGSNMGGNMGNMGNMRGNMSNMPNSQPTATNQLNMHFGTDRMTDQEIKMRHQQMNDDRNKDLTLAPTTTTFNPMMSPSMMTPNNQNFIKGGVVQDFNNMKPEDLEKYISSIKKTTSITNTIDLKKIQSMSSRDIGNLIQKLKKNGNISSQETEVSPSENKKKRATATTKDSLQSSKPEVLDLIMKLKKQNKDRENRLNNDIVSDIQDRSTETLKPVSKNKNQGKVTISLDDNSQTIDDSSDESDIILDKTPEPSKPNTDIITKDSGIKEIPSVTFTVKADEVTEPIYYNDYMVELPKKVTNVSSIEISKYKFADYNISIDESNNECTFSMKGEEKTIQLDEGKYDIAQIIETIQNTFDEENTDLYLKIEPESDKVIIHNKNSTKFELINDDKSILRVFGFTKNVYKGNSTYKGEEAHKLNNTVYMYIQNISKDEPFAIIHLGKNNTIKKQFDKPIPELTELIITFKRMKTMNDILFDFQKKPHEITFKFNTSTSNVANKSRIKTK